MNIIEEAEMLILKLETGKTMNSNDYRRVYKELTGKQYTGGNCPPCLRTANGEMRLKIQKIKESKNCLDCKNKIEEIILEDIDKIEKTEIIFDDKLIPKTNKKKHGK